MPYWFSASVEDISTSTDLTFYTVAHRHSEVSLRPLKEEFAIHQPKIRGAISTQSSFYGALPSPSTFEYGKTNVVIPQAWTKELSALNHDPCKLSTVALPITPKSSPEPRKAVDSCPFPLQPAPSLIPSQQRMGKGRGSQKAPRRCCSAEPRYLTPPASPDRYISNRQSQQATSNTFRTSKSPHQLSSTERLLRQKSATPDPFHSPSPTRLREGRRLASGFEESQTSRSPSRIISSSNVLGLARSPLALQDRQVSAGAVWNVGGHTVASLNGPVQGISNGRGGLIGSGTNAPMYTSRFLEEETPDEDLDRLEGRLAAAFDIDQTNRVLDVSCASDRRLNTNDSSTGHKRKYPYVDPRTSWKDGAWARGGAPSFLDAPQLRDDYYCSVLAYCHTSRTLAVGLSSRVYLWSEAFGVQYPRMEEATRRNTYVTSLSFSSNEGGHSILAIGRNDGQISLWSLFDDDTRFLSKQPYAVACLAFKPVTTRRPSERFGSLVATEELLVGDELGNVYYYSIEWMSNNDVDIHGWHGAMTLLAKISVHTQQICGIAWSPDGDFFATGANDNACCLFVVKDIFNPPGSLHSIGSLERNPLHTLISDFGLPNMASTSSSQHELTSVLGREYRGKFNLEGSRECFSFPNILVTQAKESISQPKPLLISEGRQKHRWLHSAAIKAIAFCPWQRGLVATGGGSNDRAIHFYHTFSGACLATINVQAQVTSLIWSTSRREIAATFGYAQPDHPYRIAVFSWPECRQVVAIPWANDMRALLAIPYPGGPNETYGSQAGEGKTWLSRTAEEGCLVVACSDESVKFHEVWSGRRKSTGGNLGLLGGSDILEGLEGVEREGREIIR